ncbi:MAG TPA: TldD/PmbA family protein [Elusimicrobiota bacterium]|nr:TldD/PmbA family protein [Elusimicrobiota bacterium]
MEDLKALAQQALADIRGRLPAGAEAELYVSRSSGRSVELRRGRLDAVEDSESAGAGLRIIQEGRAAFASCGGLDPRKISGLLEPALAQLKHSPSDYFRSFAPPDAGQNGAAEALAASLWDQSVLSGPWQDKQKDLEALCAAALGADARAGEVLRAGYHETRGESAVVNSRGLVSAEKGTFAGAGASVLARQNGESQIGAASASARKNGSFDFKRLGAQAAQRACALLGARQAESGPRAVIFDPWISGEFLDLIADLLCADAVHKGKSLLAKKLGLKIASPLATFTDDPRLPGGAASSLYDDEGCATKRKTMIKDGILQEYFYDIYCANKDGRRGNASAARGSYRGLPGPSASNFYLAPGQTKREDIIAGTKKGILVLEAMGMHMVDPVSGEFSIGVSGLEIENGRLGAPVRSAMISGNLMDVLARIDAVGSDLVFYGSTGAPTFRIAELSVA